MGSELESKGEAIQPPRAKALPLAKPMEGELGAPWIVPARMLNEVTYARPSEVGFRPPALSFEATGVGSESARLSPRTFERWTARSMV
jgi:hypothetical protein